MAGKRHRTPARRPEKAPSPEQEPAAQVSETASSIVDLQGLMGNAAVQGMLPGRFAEDAGTEHGDGGRATGGLAGWFGDAEAWIQNRVDSTKGVD